VQQHVARALTDMDEFNVRHIISHDTGPVRDLIVKLYAETEGYRRALTNVRAPREPAAHVLRHLEPR
jgi:hypothetical protein